MMVYDKSNPTSYKDLEKWHTRVTECFNSRSGAAPPPFAIIANKSDKAEGMGICPEAAEMEWVTSDDARASVHLNTSAMNYRSVSNAFDTIT